MVGVWYKLLKQIKCICQAFNTKCLVLLFTNVSGSPGAGTISITLKSGANLILTNLPTSAVGPLGSVYKGVGDFLKINP